MNSFLQACGASDPVRLAIRGPFGNEAAPRTLEEPYAIVGRDDRADIVLDHSLVSRRHLYLQVIGGEIFWVDLASRSGTFYDGQLQTTGWLDPGKPIRVGSYGLERVQEEGPIAKRVASRRTTPLLARTSGEGHLPEVFLEFLNGPSRSARWPMNRVMSLVGSAAGCKFRLDDPSVARFHCCLIRTPAGLWVVDLLGHDGISVNDEPARHACLRQGDVVQIGRYRMRIHCQPAERAIAEGQAARALPPRVSVSLAQAMPLPPQPKGLPGFTTEGIPGDLATILQSGVMVDSAHSWPRPELPPAYLEKGNISESLLVSVVNQFGMMQQQMLDQFQQTVGMLVQTFGNLHREQMDTIREELDHIHRLSKEFQEIKQQLAAWTPSAPKLAAAPGQESASAAEAPAASRSTAQDRPRALQADGAATPLAAPVPAPAATGPIPLSIPTATSSASPDIPAASSPSPATPLTGRSTAAAASSASAFARPAPEPRVAQGPPSGRRQAATDARPETDRDMVVWLHQRMVHLQQERETRWQKILKMLPGVS